MYKICIADDEEYILKSISQRIEQSGMDVKIVGTAKNGIEAYQLYEREKPDIFYVDINMPLCKGIDFIERVRAMDKESITKFIIISGYDDFVYMKKAIQTRVENYILKPIQNQEFLDTLQKACEGLKEIMERRQEYWGKHWEFFNDACAKEDEKNFSGTILFFWSEHFFNRYRGNEEEEIKFTDLLPREKWRYIRFHGNENVGMVLGKDIWLNEQKIYTLWEQVSAGSNVYLVYKMGREMELDKTMENLENTLNLRFWKGTTHILRAETAEKEMKEYTLDTLDRDIENMQEEKWKQEIGRIFTDIFADKRNKTLLTEFYQSVLILAANKCVQHNFDIPGDLKEELHPFSLSKYLTKEELQKKAESCIGCVYDKIVAEAGKGDLVERVIRYMESHYADNLALTDISNQFFVVPNYLAKRFKEKKDMTAMQYLENYRMQKAGELLSDTELSVAEIAHKVGYNDGNYFTRNFRKKYGISPREYRNR